MRLQQLVRACITSAAFLGAVLILQAASAMGQGLAKDLGPQSLADALDIFAADTGLQVVYHSEIATGLKSQGARAGLSAEETLRQLLRETGLTFEFLNDRTIAIRAVSAVSGSNSSQTPSAPHAGSSGHGTAKTGDWLDRLRLAQAESSTSASSSAASVAAEKNVRASDPSVVELGEVVVTGTHIRGVYPDSSPVDIYTAEDIESMGVTTTQEFISRLPQNSSTLTDTAPAPAIGGVSNFDTTSSPDLRGLGPGTTLTLVNGRRLALGSFGRSGDVSAIPASAVARVEVLSDGASAIYGSDAVGGVVNFVLRDEFEGLETRANYSTVTSGGLHREGLTQTGGVNWTDGRGLVSVDYLSASALDSSDRPYTAGIRSGYLTPEDQSVRAFSTISQDFGERLTVGGDLLLSQRETETVFTPLPEDPGENFGNITSEAEQYLANLGIDYQFDEAFHGSLRATYATRDTNTRYSQDLPSISPTTNRYDTEYSALAITPLVAGSLFELPGGAVRFALGGDYMEEQYRQSRTISQGAGGRDLGRATASYFAEMFLPLIGGEQNIPLVHRLELTLAARHTNFEDTSEPALRVDFGSDISPKFGLLWSPHASLNLRATWGESFRAPALQELDPTSNRISFQNSPVAGVSSPTLFLLGSDSGLGAETATTYTIGFDYRPAWHSGLRISATYWNYDYVDRIGVPNTVPGQLNPSAFPQLVHRPSSLSEIEDIVMRAAVFTEALPGTFPSLSDPAALAQAIFALPNVWIVDRRSTNFALSKLDGFDLSIRDRIETTWGNVSLGANLTRYLSYDEQASPGSPIVTVVDTVLRPASLKGRAYVGFMRNGFQSQLNVNYVDDYSNPFAAGGVQPKVDSWTTVDWNVSYRFDREGFLDDLRLAFNVQNLLDQDPPTVLRTAGTNPRVIQSIGYDPANANPIGRLVALSLTKQW